MVIKDFGAEPIRKKDLVMFYLIDTSGSMDGTMMDCVNDAMLGICDELLDVGSLDVRVAALTFDSQCRWINADSPVPAETFKWTPVSGQGHTCCMGQAFRMLNEKLSCKAWMKQPHESFTPVIILFSNSIPTDDFEGGLEELKKNSWFKYSLKVAFAIDQQANKEYLEKFTENPELSLITDNGKDLVNKTRKMFEWVIPKS